MLGKINLKIIIISIIIFGLLIIVLMSIAYSQDSIRLIFRYFLVGMFEELSFSLLSTAYSRICERCTEYNVWHTTKLKNGEDFTYQVIKRFF